MARELGAETSRVTGALTSMSLDEMVSNLAIGIAEGQTALDRSCMDIALFMGQAQIAFGQREDGEPNLISLLELGFTPNFYQFVDTILEIKVSISCAYEEKQELSSKQAVIDENESEQHSDYSQAQSSQGSSSHVGWRGSWWGRGWGYGASVNRSNSSRQQSSSYSSGQSSKQKSIAVNTVDAKFSSSYNYSLEASSTVKLKIVPLPPPTVFEERLRDMIANRRRFEEDARALQKIGRLANEWAASATDSAEKLEPKKLGPNRDISSTLIHITTMANGYDEVNDHHWSLVTGSLEIRKNADGHITSIRRYVEELNDTSSDIPDDDFTKLKEDLIKSLDGFSKQMESLRVKIDEITNNQENEEEQSSSKAKKKNNKDENPS